MLTWKQTYQWKEKSAKMFFFFFSVMYEYEIHTLLKSFIFCLLSDIWLQVRVATPFSASHEGGETLQMYPMYQNLCQLIVPFSTHPDPSWYQTIPV